MLKFLSIASALSFVSFLSIGQQRQVDLKVEITEPVANSVIQPNANFTIKAKISNLGQDSLLAGDSLFYSTTLETNPQIGTLNTSFLLVNFSNMTFH
jgi:hypothetical protein